LFAFKHPGKNKEDHELGCGLEKLSRLERVAQRSPYQLLRQRIFKGDAPEVVSGFAVTASGCEAAKSSDRVAHGEARRECVASGERRHVMLAQKPGRSDEGANQTAGKYASRLQCRQAENLSRMLRVVAP